MAGAGGQGELNPCCGVKLKSAVVLIAAIDIIYGCLFLTFGIIVAVADSTPQALKDGLEMTNLITRPVMKIIAGAVLMLSALCHLKLGGFPSAIGCVVWILIQLGLFGLTSIRFVMYLKSSSSKKDPQYYVNRGGLSNLEVLAVMTSVLPFTSVFVLWYEIVCVGFFMLKIFRDRTLLEEATKVLKDVETQLERCKSKVDEMVIENVQSCLSVGHSCKVKKDNSKVRSTSSLNSGGKGRGNKRKA